MPGQQKTFFFLQAISKKSILSKILRTLKVPYDCVKKLSTQNSFRFAPRHEQKIQYSIYFLHELLQTSLCIVNMFVFAANREYDPELYSLIYNKFGIKKTIPSILYKYINQTCNPLPLGQFYGISKTTKSIRHRR